MITWPAFIKFAGDDELSFIATQSVWENDANLSQFHYDPMDQLIDANGVIYSLLDHQNEILTPQATGEKIELEALTNLVRAHAAQLGNCCVAKLGFYSVAEAVASVGMFTDSE